MTAQDLYNAEQRLSREHHCSALDVTHRGNVAWCKQCGKAIDIKPRTGAYVRGRAVPIGIRCTMFDADGSSHMEMFAPGAFAIQYPHDVKLRVNHNDRSAIPCSLVFSIKPDGIDFAASLPESPQARALLARLTTFVACQSSAFSTRQFPIADCLTDVGLSSGEPSSSA